MHHHNDRRDPDNSSESISQSQSLLSPVRLSVYLHWPTDHKQANIIIIVFVWSEQIAVQTHINLNIITARESELNHWRTNCLFAQVSSGRANIPFACSQPKRSLESLESLACTVPLLIESDCLTDVDFEFVESSFLKKLCQLIIIESTAKFLNSSLLSVT